MVEHQRRLGWADVEDYLSATLVRGGSSMDRVLRSIDDAGMPRIEVAPTAGKLLMLLARIQGASSTLLGLVRGPFNFVWDLLILFVMSQDIGDTSVSTHR
ncbi:hypothetical protein [Arthrobacter sp. E3]|uniref:hypothetical protein n=1 Tax=Arthrobacter sp. E3 TaxID=517402 RepID=UPI001A93EE3D|nr:hypothetical protein [Arthrobacter sp. E3]